MKYLCLWLAYLIVGILLLGGKAIVYRILRILHSHYQLGFSPVVKTIELFGLKLSIGIIIPLPWLFKIYEIHNGKKQKVNLLWQHRELSFLKRFAGIFGGIAILYFAIMLIFSLSNLSIKHTYLSLDEVNKRGVFVNEEGERLGLQSGDRILAVNGESPERFSDLQKILFH